MTVILTGRRRGLHRLVRICGAALGLTHVPGPVRAVATSDRVERAIAEHVGHARRVDGPLELGIAPIIENGNSVPVRLSVPNAPDGAVRTLSMLLIAPANPDPKVVSWHLTPFVAEANIATRIRLADSQTVIAIARMSDDTWRRTEREVSVTIGGCYDLVVPERRP